LVLRVLMGLALGLQADLLRLPQVQ
jgi:hypothetical protein